MNRSTRRLRTRRGNGLGSIGIGLTGLSLGSTVITVLDSSGSWTAALVAAGVLCLISAFFDLRTAASRNAGYAVLTVFFVCVTGAFALVPLWFELPFTWAPVVVVVMSGLALLLSWIARRRIPDAAWQH